MHPPQAVVSGNVYAFLYSISPAASYQLTELVDVHVHVHVPMLSVTLLLPCRVAEPRGLSSGKRHWLPVSPH
jgi:hypothetical protein